LLSTLSMSASYPLVRNLYAFSTRFGVSRRPSRSGSSPRSISSLLIASCIFLFYIPAAAAQSADPPSRDARSGEAERLYADRANLASARRAADLWRAALDGDARDFDAAWKLARADYWLGGHGPDAERRKDLDRGIEAGRKAAALEPNRPEGHFWIAANMGALADSFGIRQGLTYRKPIKEELETVLRIDPAFGEGSADRALGRWYFKVPRLFGGDRKRAESHLRQSLTYNPNSTVSHLFLAELLQDEGRKDEARAEYQKVLDAPISQNWAPEDQEFKERAGRALAGLK
jgi:tetratricopeptide (TPR) repeat protein